MEEAPLIPSANRKPRLDLREQEGTENKKTASSGAGGESNSCSKFIGDCLQSIATCGGNCCN